MAPIDRTLAAIAFVALLTSLVVYVRAAVVSSNMKITHPDDFFLARGSGSSDQFAAAQIAYGLQMSTVFPYFMLAVTGNWWFAAANILSYAVGIGIFYWFVSRLRGDAGQLLTDSRTIHAFIARVHAASHLRRLASVLTVVAFAGLAAFEIVYGASVFRALGNGSAGLYYVSIVTLAGYLVAYLWAGGQRAALRTDQLQLALSYAGLHAALAYLLMDDRVLISSMTVPLLPLLILLASLIMFIWRLLLLKRLWFEPKAEFVRRLYPLILVSLALLMFSIVTKEGVFTFEWPVLPPSSTPDLWPMLATAVVLPLLFQIVDITNWQRMRSLSRNPADAKREALKGLKLFAFESPLSWVLPIALGFAAVPLLPQPALSSADAWTPLIQWFLSGGSIFKDFAAVALCVAVVAIFMSTADGLLSAVGYAFAYDLDGRGRRLMDRNTLSEAETGTVVARGKGGLLVITAIVVVGFIIADILLKRGTDVLTIFMSFYTPLIAFTPAVILPALSGSAAPSAFASTALITGSLLGLGCGIASVVGMPALGWYASPLALGASWTIYLFGFAIRRVAINNRESPLATSKES